MTNPIKKPAWEVEFIKVIDLNFVGTKCLLDKRIILEKIKALAIPYIRQTRKEAVRDVLGKVRLESKKQTSFKSCFDSKKQCTDCGVEPLEFHHATCTRLHATIYNQAVANIETLKKRILEEV